MFLEKIFSVKTEKTHKIYNFFGIKIKLKITKRPQKLSNKIFGENNFVYILNGENKEILDICYSGLNIEIEGNNNEIILHEGLIASNSNIVIKNSNCHIELCSTPHFNNVNIVCVNGDGQEVYIGENCSFAPMSRCQITLDDDNKLIIGKDCMFSNTIDIWCTDGHTILDVETGEIINRQKRPLKIGNHCWIGQYAKLMKNTQLSDDTIVGIGAVVTKSFTDRNVVVAGNPAQIVKHGVTWSNEPISKYKNSNK